MTAHLSICSPANRRQGWQSREGRSAVVTGPPGVFRPTLIIVRSADPPVVVRDQDQVIDNPIEQLPEVP